MSRQLPILVVDDDVRVLKGLSLLLNQKYLVSEAADGIQAIKKATEEEFYCVVLDVKMQGINGFEVFKKIKDINRDTPIIFYTAYHDEHDLTEIINTYRPYGYVEKGVSATILKNLVESAVKTYQVYLERESQKEELEETNTALRVLLKNIEKEKNEIVGDINNNLKKLVLPYLHDAVAMTKSEKIRENINIAEDNIRRAVVPFLGRSAKLYSLSPKELKVANLIKSQKSSKEIADIMFISIKTVEFHRRNLRHKLEIKNKKTNLRAYLATTDL